MAKQYKGNEKRHICALVAKHGLTGARKILKKERRGRNVPDMLTLSAVADSQGVKSPERRGRPTVYDWDSILKLYTKHKSHKGVRAALEAAGKPCPTNPMLVAKAAAAGIEVKLGRPCVETAA